MAAQTDLLPWRAYAIRLIACALVGLGVFLAGAPAGVSHAGWIVFAVFAATIVGFLLRPLPMGALVVIGIALERYIIKGMTAGAVKV